MENLTIPYRKMCLQSFVEITIKTLYRLFIPIALLIFQIVRSSGASSNLVPSIIAVGLFVFILYTAIGAYSKTFYYIDEVQRKIYYLDEFANYVELVISFDNIHNLTKKRTLLQRILGYYEIHIDGGLANGKSDIVLKVGNKESDRIYDLLKAVGVNEAGFTVLNKSTGKDIFLFGIMNSSMIAFAFALVTFTFEMLSRFEDATGKNYVVDGRLTVALSISPFILILLTILFIAILLLGAIGYPALKVLNHQVIKENNDYILRYGFLKEYNVDVNRDKINSVQFKQKIVARLLGRGSLFFQKIGFGDKKGETACIGLVDKIEDSFNSYLSIYGDDKVSIKIKRGKFVGTFSAILVGAISYIVFRHLFNVRFEPSLIYTILIFTMLILRATLLYYANGYQVLDKYFVLSSGVIKKNVTLIEKSKVNVLSVQANIIERFFKRGTLLFYYHSNKFNHPIKVRNVRLLDIQSIENDAFHYLGGNKTMNLRQIVFTKIKDDSDELDKMKLKDASEHIGTTADELSSFIRGNSPGFSGELLKELCLYLDIDRSKFHKGYFEK